MTGHILLVGKDRPTPGSVASQLPGGEPLVDPAPSLEGADRAARTRGPRADVPLELEEGEGLVRGGRARRRDFDVDAGIDAFVGVSKAARDLREQVRRIARSPARAILIEGESGTGKGLVARAVHAESARAAAPFIALTCSAIPEHLLESELFGHEPGAFTDARRRRIGLVEAADGGTLFLDEIGDMPPSLQAKLLGVLEERRFRRVGGTREIEVDLCVVSATHQDLRALVDEGRFRRDLLYRLYVVPVRVPSLRERREDVGMLAEHFAARFAEGSDQAARRIQRPALEFLASLSWPGNARELRNAVERAAILARGEELTKEDFLEGVAARAPLTDRRRPSIPLPASGVNVQQVLDDFVREALARSGGNQCAAARLLGMSRDQIRYRVSRLKSCAERADGGRG